MAAARIFLFGSRDVWFVVGLPVFLYSQGWRYMEVAGFIASWTIGYGLVQAIAPSVIRRSPDGLSREVPEARLWGAVLTAIPLVLALVLQRAPHVARPDLVVIVGLGIFGFAFAVISSLHSYLILAYAGSEKAAEDVGFYYAANAGGRLSASCCPARLRKPAGWRPASGDRPRCWRSASRSPSCCRRPLRREAVLPPDARHRVTGLPADWLRAARQFVRGGEVILTSCCCSAPISNSPAAACRR